MIKLFTIIVLALVITACGESKEDKMKALKIKLYTECMGKLGFNGNSAIDKLGNEYADKECTILAEQNAASLMEKFKE